MTELVPLSVIGILGWCFGAFLGEIFGCWLVSRSFTLNPQKLYDLFKEIP